MPLAILTKVVPATLTKPKKLKVMAGKKQRVFSWEELINKLISENNPCVNDFVHREAAFQFRDELGWEGTLVSGELPNGDIAHTFYK